MPNLSKNAERFRAANEKSPVASGAVIGEGGRGCRYTLKNGQIFTLSRDDCVTLGCPRWDLPK